MNIERDKPQPLDGMPEKTEDVSAIGFNQMLFLLDFRIYSKYMEFSTRRGSVVLSLMLMAFLTCLMSPIYVLAVHDSILFKDDNEHEYRSAYQAYIILQFIILALGWFMVYLKVASVCFTNNTNFNSKIVDWLPFAVNCFSFVLTAMFCFGLILRTQTGECGYISTKFDTTMWWCNPESESNALPHDSMLIVMLLPLVYSIVWRETTWSVTLLSWAVCSTALVVSLLIGDASTSQGPVGFLIPLNFAILYECQRQRLLSFLSIRGLQSNMANNMKEVDEASATEMRHMIGNVAHDLKTVSVFFVP